ncbi:MAG: glycosyltransferase [Psittacicella sp.]
MIKNLTIYNLSQENYQKQKPKDFFKNFQLNSDLNHFEYGFIDKDNTGDNISLLFPYYGALTAHYWIWKNHISRSTKEKDFIGICYHDRQFYFGNKSSFNILEHQDLFLNATKDCYDQIESIFPENNIEKYLKDNDIILIEPENTSLNTVLPEYRNKTNYQRYIDGRILRKEDFEALRDSIIRKHSNLLPYFDNYMNSCVNYHQVFIMNSDTYNKYASFMFGVLSDVEKGISFGEYAQVRTPIFELLGRFLLNIFIAYQIDSNKKCLTIPALVIGNSLKEVEILKHTDEYKEFLLCFDDNYAKHAGALISSIITNSHKDHKYSFNLVCDKVSNNNITRFKTLIKPYQNFKLRFLDANCIYDLTKANTENSVWTPIIFARLFVASIFPNLDRIVYLDSDMIALDDVYKLQTMNLEGNAIAATTDFGGIVHDAAYQKKMIDMYDRRAYTESVIGIYDMDKYIQSNLVVFDLDKLRELNLYDTFMSEISNDYKMPDQDILNIHLKGKIKYLDMSWNVMCSSEANIQYFIPFVPFNKYKEYIEALNNAKLIHFIGEKPWNNKSVLNADLYFDALLNSPWGEANLNFSLKNHIIAKNKATY